MRGAILTSRGAGLKTIPLFSELTANELEVLASTARVQTYPKGSIVFQEGDPGDYLMIILSGKVKVSLLGEKGQEIILAFLGPKSFFGEMALLESEPRSATVFTTEKSMFLRLEKKNFFNLLSRQPAMGLKILKYVSSRLRQANEQIRSLAMFDVYGRLARCLLNLAQTQGLRTTQHILIKDRPTLENLSHMVGCSRETLSRAMKVLQANGCITMTKKDFIIKRTW